MSAIWVLIYMQWKHDASIGNQYAASRLFHILAFLIFFSIIGLTISIWYIKNLWKYEKLVKKDEKRQKE